MLVLGFLDAMTLGAVNLPAMVPPFGASVVIVFFTPESPFGRPRNVILGHVLSAVVTLLVLAALPGAPKGVLAAVAVSVSGVAMLATRSFHPPGGATALLAVLAEGSQGLSVLLSPVLLGAVTLTATRLGLDASIGWATRGRALEGVEESRAAEPGR